MQGDQPEKNMEHELETLFGGYPANFMQSSRFFGEEAGLRHTKTGLTCSPYSLMGNAGFAKRQGRMRERAHPPFISTKKFPQ